MKDPTAVETQLLEDLIQSVVDSLNHLDQFDPSQMLPQLRERLNQWILQSRRTDTWKLDPLIDTLSPQLASNPVVAQIVRNFDRGLFTMHDMIGLQETIWLRNIAKAARGSQLDDVSVAEQLFDWTVRNLQLVEEPDPAKPSAQNSVAEILLSGRATARERAWIFLLLLRQQGLDGVMLAIPSGDDSPPREWLPALVTDNDLVLFDSWLGMPLPGSDGKHTATLAEVAASDEQLRKLDLDANRPYPVKAEQLAHLVAYVEASPVYLSRRMETLDGRMTGERRVVLVARPGRLAERLRGRPGIEDVRYWPMAYEFLQSRSTIKPGQLPPGAQQLVVFQMVEPLAKARVLQFKGEFDGPRGATANYLNARLLDRQSRQKGVSAAPRTAADSAEGQARRQLLAGPDRLREKGLSGGDRLFRPADAGTFARWPLDRRSALQPGPLVRSLGPILPGHRAVSSRQLAAEARQPAARRRLKAETADKQAVDETKP